MEVMAPLGREASSIDSIMRNDVSDF